MKDRYPLAPMERYARWTREDGAPLDPWMRVHWRLGAEIVRVAPRALVIVGAVAAWEEWTGMRFPDSGPYVVPGRSRPWSSTGTATRGATRTRTSGLVHRL